MTPSISEPLLRKMWPHGDSKMPGLIEGIAASSAQVFASNGITTPLQVAHIMAQISHECGAGLEVVENLGYSARRMTQVWPSRFPSIASALPYANNPRKLADKVYNGRMGNRPGSDDGYDFRGRGASQTTGREGYQKLAARTGLDLLNNPDLINDPQHFLECGIADFILCGCLPFCAPRPGLPDGDIRGVTHHLNGGYIGLSERQAWFARWKAALRAPARVVALASYEAQGSGFDSGASGHELQGRAAAPADQDDETDVSTDDGMILRYGSEGYEVKALQGQLVDLGYQVGSRDEDFGAGTRAAVLAFQADNGLPTTGEVDAATKAALKTAPPKPISEKRMTATADDLAAGGSETVATGQSMTWWGKGLTLLGISGGAGHGAQKLGALDAVKDTTEHLSAVREVVSQVQDIGGWAISTAATYWWLLLLALGFVGIRYGGAIIERRLADHRAAFNMKQ